MTLREMRAVIALMEFRDWRFVIELKRGERFLVAEFEDTCAATGTFALQRSRKWRLSKHMTRSEFVQTAFKAVHTAMEHEVREQFLYAGRPIFGPHFDIQKLHALCDAPGAHDKR